METIIHPPSLLRRHWLNAMLTVELIPAFMALIGLLISLSDFELWYISAYFLAGLVLYGYKLAIAMGHCPGEKARRVLAYNGSYVLLTLGIGGYMGLEVGFETWSLPIFSYLLCSATISFLATQRRYDLIR